MTVGTQKQIVVVLGMHRSGTSALTKSLELLGVGLGNAFKPALKQNPKGFWEDKDCLELNEKILVDNNLKWYDLNSLDGISADPTKGESLEAEAFNIIKTRLADFNLWGFKDPRTCRTIPFWEKVFQTIDCEPLYVIAIRNPLSVADSLDKRDGILKVHSLLLWAEHTLVALKHTENAKRVVVDYDLLISQPIKELTRMAEGLSLQKISPEDPKTQDYCNNFLEEGLRHSSYTMDSLLKDPEVPEFIKNLYCSLRSVAEDVETLSGPTLLAAIKESDREFAASNSFLKSLNLIARKGLENANLARELLSERGEELATSVHSLKSRLAATESKLANTLKENQIVKEQNKKLTEESAEQKRLNSEYKHIIQEIFESKSWKITQPLRRMADYSRALIRR